MAFTRKATIIMIIEEEGVVYAERHVATHNPRALRMGPPRQETCAAWGVLPLRDIPRGSRILLDETEGDVADSFLVLYVP